MANYPKELAQDAAYQSHTVYLTDLVSTQTGPRAEYL
jgi:hypothetical protein